MAICKSCGKEIPTNEILRHRWAEHREECLAKARLGGKRHMLGKGAEVDGTPGTPETPSQDGKDKVKPEKSATSTTIATAVAPKPAAIVFMLGKLEIPMDPQDLYEAYILYQDIKSRVGLKDGFSSALKDAMGVSWRLLVARPSIEAKVETELMEVQQNG